MTQSISRSQPHFGHVYKAFVVQGGTREQRNEAINRQLRGERILMRGIYDDSTGDKTGIMFTDNHSDYENGTFEKVQKLAGTRPC
jgi:hypothetical protein